MREPRSSSLADGGQITPAAGEAIHWYACQTRARAEKRVERLLLEREFDAYLPTMTQRRRWADRSRLVTFPMFPSYVFSRFLLHQVYHVLAIPGVSSVVRLGGRPAPIPDAEIDNVRRLAAGLCHYVEQPVLRPFREGDRVRVTGGPFQGMEGVVIRLRRKAYVLVGLRTIGQSISIHIDEDLLESTASASHSSQGNNHRRTHS